MTQGYDFTQFLPVEITDKILELCNARELSTFQCVCLNWREFGNSDELWFRFCAEKHFIHYGPTDDILQEESYSRPTTNVSGNSPLFELIVPGNSRLSPICKWKHIFLRRIHLNTNWRKGRYSVTPVLRGHTDKVTAFDCNGKILISGSDDKTLRVWDVRNSQCIRKISGHSDTVTAVKILGDQVITGCGDSLIRVINYRTGKVVLTFMGHGGSVDHLCLSGSKLVSAGTDRTTRVWCLETKELKQIMRLHTDEIECLSSHGSFAVSGSWDNTLVLWNLRTGQCVHHCIGHSEVVTCCQFDFKKIVSGSADGDVRVWSCLTGLCLHVLSGHEGEIYCLVYNEILIATGSSDSTVKMWTHEGKFLRSLDEHMGVVRCLHINEDRLVSGGDQSMVVVWDYKKGKKMTVLHRHPNKLHLMWGALEAMISIQSVVIVTTPKTDGPPSDQVPSASGTGGDQTRDFQLKSGDVFIPSTNSTSNKYCKSL